MNNKNILVSICCITYNHGKFLRETLDGFFAQKTSFLFEVLIHDDCSTDNTKSIIEEYANKFPEIIFPVFQTENQHSKGLRRMNPRFNFPRARGKYIAMCEGDDYWTDPLKLQKQVDFLESNPDFNLCIHPSLVINTISGEKKIRDGFKKDVYQYDDVITKFIGAPTSSFVFRNNIVFPDWFYSVYGGDRAIVVLNSLRGKIKVLDFVGSVYRIHTGGVDNSYKKNKFALPIRNIKEQFIYLNVANEKHHKKTISKNIISNHIYVLFWSLRKLDFRVLYNTARSMLLFLLFKKIAFK